MEHRLTGSAKVPFLRRRAGPLFIALAINGGLLGLAGLVVVARALRAPEPEFAASLRVQIPPEPWDQELDEGAADGGASAATSEVERVMLDEAVADGPALPALEATQPERVDRSDLLSGMAQGFLNQAGFSGLAAASSASGAASFFGVEDTGDRIVLVVNTSASVLRRAKRRGVTIERIQSEVAAVVDGLSDRCEFGLVHFSQGVRLFSPRLAPATPGNRQAFSQWVSASLRGNPLLQEHERFSGHEAALGAALKLEPDIIFLVTDGQLERRAGAPGAWTYPIVPVGEFLRSLKALRKEGSRSVRLHVVGFELGQREREAMQELARAFDGKVREF